MLKSCILLTLSLRQGFCNGTVSVRPSVCLSHLSTAACRCGGFVAVGPASGTHRSIAAAAGRHSSMAHSSECEQ